MMPDHGFYSALKGFEALPCAVRLFIFGTCFSGSFGLLTPKTKPRARRDSLTVQLRAIWGHLQRSKIAFRPGANGQGRQGTVRGFFSIRLAPVFLSQAQYLAVEFQLAPNLVVRNLWDYLVANPTAL